MELSDSCDIQISESGDTLWVHVNDGSTIGRLSKRAGMDIHRSVSDQLAGLGQCLHCTHHPASAVDWLLFVSLMKKYFDVTIPSDAMTFDAIPDLRTKARL